MGTKGREVPRVVCCAIPITSAAGKVLVITSRKRQDLWVCACFPFPLPFLHPLQRVMCSPHVLLLSGLWLSFLVVFAAYSLFSSTKRGLGAHRCNIGGSSIAGSLRRRSHPLSLYPSSHLLMNVLSHSLPSLLNFSGRSWQNHTIRDNHQVTLNNISLLRA